MYCFIYSLFVYHFLLSNHRRLTFDDLQDLEEQDFELLGGDKCP
jgi:hypothetical protein